MVQVLSNDRSSSLQVPLKISFRAGMRKVSQGLVQAAKEMAKTAKEFRRVGTGVNEEVTGDIGQESYQVRQAIRALDGPNFVPVPCRFYSWAMQGEITKGQVSESGVLGHQGLTSL